MNAQNTKPQAAAAHTAGEGAELATLIPDSDFEEIKEFVHGFLDGSPDRSGIADKAAHIAGLLFNAESSRQSSGPVGAYRRMYHALVDCYRTLGWAPKKIPAHVADNARAAIVLAEGRAS